MAGTPGAAPRGAVSDSAALSPGCRRCRSTASEPPQTLSPGGATCCRQRERKIDIQG